MKQFFFAFFSVLLSIDTIAAVIVQSPTSSREEYNAFIKSHAEAVSYVRYFTDKLQSNSHQEDLLYKIAERLDASPKEILLQLRTIESGAALSATSINFIYDLSNKLQERSEFKNNTELKTLQCKVRGLLSVPLETCAKVKVDIQAITRQWPTTDTLLIESVPYDLTTGISLEISSEAAYQFTLLSNTHKAILFRGTFVQLMQQHFVPEPMVSGTCDAFSAAIDDFTIASNGLIFFNPNCTKSIKTPQTESHFIQWVEKNKYWVYPAGVLLIGGAGAYALKDKKIVVTKP
ncbi:hypothetical protein B9G69_001095 [Bdellovibrio sp. SKB1291214]|uniref:hypothetical protein n=1 Tax=Bdellovibrio sp. SKB1291214 TaxID=1732569 RepID=UPI000B51E19E|nr:hypothetical protein [Bdellovibrio sp. SKB1291214]UYL09171.1 hypothetical protein B9G69_001095 [Bdellovibrio sp. SKB1291214]